MLVENIYLHDEAKLFERNHGADHFENTYLKRERSLIPAVKVTNYIEIF